jgi:hypothetical protein
MVYKHSGDLHIWFCPFTYIFLVFFSPILNGQIIFQDTKEETSQEETIRMFQMALPIWDTIEHRYGDNYRLDILYAGDDVIMVCDGFFDVFLWQNSGWKRLNKARKGGYNFGGKHFVWNNRIFSFGGYGYWRQHADLLEFNLNNGEWKILSLPENIPFAPLYTTSDGFKVISDNCYDVNLKQLSVKKYPIGFNSEILIKDLFKLHKMHSSKWDFLVAGVQNLLLHKQQNKLYYSNQNTIELFDKLFFHDRSIIQFKNDSIIRWTSEGTVSNVIDVRNLLSYYKLLDVSDEKNFPYYRSLLIVLLVLLTGYYLMWQRLRKKKLHAGTKWQYPVIQEIVKFSGQIINVDQLDILLNLGGVKPIEYRKFKRAKIIAGINAEYQIKAGKELVLRFKDAKDGRKFLYKIQP